MATNSKRRVKFTNIILLLCGLIIVIFLVDFLWRSVVSPMTPNGTEEILTIEGEFASEASTDSSAATEPTTKPTEKATEDPKHTDTTEETEETTEENKNKQVIKLTEEDLHNGPLVLVSGTCPYVGSQNFVDFSTISDYNVIPRDYSLNFQIDMRDALCNLFDAYAYDNGYVNLQIYSTSEIYAGADSLYTTVLSERSSGYTFDIGLITSTGEVVAYLTKRNEWMFNNCWSYGFIVRYSDMKTGTTGVGFMPHHFRYVGLPHAMLMNDYGYCLEEYLQFLTPYTMEAGPLSCNYFGTTYEIYYVPADPSGETEVEIPKNVEYTVSGNNTDGYILTIVSSGEQASSDATASTDATQDPEEPGTGDAALPLDTPEEAPVDPAEISE